MGVVLTSSGNTRMLPVSIGSKIGQYHIIWNELGAVTVATPAPLVVIRTLLQRLEDVETTSACL